MTPEEVERIRKEYEDVVVEELRQALPNVHVNEIRRLLKESDSDGNKVLDFLSGIEPSEINHEPHQPEDPSNNLPNGVLNDTEQDPQDTLSRSMQILSLNTETVDQTESPPSGTMTPTIPDIENPKHKARQRRQASATRKDKQAKRAQKESARRRKRMEALGIEKDDTTEAQKPVLKAIVI